jgi:hypothetical protein
VLAFFGAMTVVYSIADRIVGNPFGTVIRNDLLFWVAWTICCVALWRWFYTLRIIAYLGIGVLSYYLASLVILAAQVQFRLVLVAVPTILFLSWQLFLVLKSDLTFRWAYMRSVRKARAKDCLLDRGDDAIPVSSDLLGKQFGLDAESPSLDQNAHNGPNQALWKMARFKGLGEAPVEVPVESVLTNASTSRHQFQSSSIIAAIALIGVALAGFSIYTILQGSAGSVKKHQRLAFQVSNQAFLSTCDISLDGTKIACSGLGLAGDSSRTDVGLWDTSDGHFMGTLPIGDSLLSPIAFAKDKDTIIVSNKEGLELRNVRSGSVEYTIRNDVDGFYSFNSFRPMLLSEDGGILAASISRRDGSRGSVVLELPTGRVLISTAEAAWTLSPNGVLFVTATGQRQDLPLTKQRMRFWSTAEGRVVEEWPLPPLGAPRISVSRNSKLLAVLGAFDMSTSCLLVFDLEKASRPAWTSCSAGLTGRAHEMTFSPDSSVLALLSDYAVVVKDARTGSDRQIIRRGGTALFFGPSSQTLYTTTSNSIREWSVQ